MRPLHLLHVFSTFKAAGPQIRFASIANALGGEFRHTIVAMDGNYEAAQRLDPKLTITLQPPPLDKGSLLCSLTMRELVRHVRPDLTLTYNWGAMDAVAGSRLAAICPTIHTEDGFNPDEAVALKSRRVLTRRLLLNCIHTTVVPSKMLLEIARTRYRLRAEKVRYIPNGVALPALGPNERLATRNSLGLRDSAVAIGYLGHLRPEKNLDVLIRAFAAANLKDSRLILVGDGESRTELTSLVRSLDLTWRVIFTGAATCPRHYLAAFDIFAMSSYTEQMPLSLLEAMACRLPVACTNAGDSHEILGASEIPFVTPIGDVSALSTTLRTLATDPALRQRIGRENRKRCETNYSLDNMVSAYGSLYRTAIDAH